MSTSGDERRQVDGDEELADLARYLLLLGIVFFGDGRRAAAICGPSSRQRREQGSDDPAILRPKQQRAVASSFSGAGQQTTAFLPPAVAFSSGGAALVIRRFFALSTMDGRSKSRARFTSDELRKRKTNRNKEAWKRLYQQREIGQPSNNVTTHCVEQQMTTASGLDLATFAL